MGLFTNFMRNTGREPISVGVNYLIQADSLSEKVAEFVDKLETEETDDWCKCLWRIHPDDQNTKPRHCRICGAVSKAATHRGLPEDFESGEAHHFLGIRKVRVDNHPECPVHTKEGLILQFVRWSGNVQK